MRKQSRHSEPLSYLGKTSYQCRVLFISRVPDVSPGLTLPSPDRPLSTAAFVLELSPASHHDFPEVCPESSQRDSFEIKFRSCHSFVGNSPTASHPLGVCCPGFRMAQLTACTPSPPAAPGPHVLCLSLASCYPANTKVPLQAL